MSPRQNKSHPIDLVDSSKVRGNENNSTVEETLPKIENSELKSHQSKADNSAKQKSWWIVAVLGISIAIAGVSYLRWRDTSTEEATTTQINPLSVRTTEALQEPIQNWISNEGTVRAVNYKHLAFEVEGDVTYLADRGGRRLREGDRVTQGELLAKVDDRELLADVSQAQAAIAEARQNRATAAAQIAQAQAQLQQARSQVRQVQSQVNKAQTSRNLAQTQLERYGLLVEQGAISESEYDTRVSTLQDAEADVTAAQAEVVSAQEQVRSAQAQVRAAQEQYKATQSAITTAEARLSQAEVALEGTRLYAPFDGIVAYLNITEGEYYSPQVVSSQLGGDYQGILDRIPMVIIDPAQYEVITDLAGTNSNKVRDGQTAIVASAENIQRSLGVSNTSNPTFADANNLTARSALLDNAIARGEVFSVNPAISPGGRAVEATISLLPETTSNSNLKHGEQVTTWIAVEEAQEAVVVPLNAIVYRDRNPYIFVVNSDNVVEQRQVQLGIKGITKQQILSGVAAGETVITQGQNPLVDGTPVKSVNN
ncbi:MAG: efflux RND transporter periplasmic adaptor subunit [Pleurocapsa sp.]